MNREALPNMGLKLTVHAPYIQVDPLRDTARAARSSSAVRQLPGALP
jgi:hypothetical protein